MSLVLVALTVTTVIACKPISYYLQQVYKAYGKVTEAGTGVPLESVEVFLGTYQYSVLTNGLGDYGIELAEGTWKLDFVKDGYVTESRMVTVNASNPRVKVDVLLTRSGGCKLSGTWAIPGSITVPNGIYGYVKLVASGGLPTDQALYWTRSNESSGGSAGYSIAGIAAGSYTVWAFIDVNGNAPNNASALPDAGDYSLQTGMSITISGNQTLNLGPSGWAGPEASFSVVGTWVNPAYNNHNGMPPARIVATADSMTFYNNDTDTTDPVFSGSYTVARDWASDGAHYFEINAMAAFGLARVSNNNNTLETNGSGTAYPTSINQSDPSYEIYTRQ
jgi:hypothetical protein